MFALTAAVLPAFNAGAQDPAITEKWKTPVLEQFKGDWSAALNWGDSEAIKGGSNPRFATAADGKIYTINQKTMAISEVTSEGLNDVYYLHEPSSLEDYYGTAIAMDEAGNFLIGMNFTARPGSSLKWTVYSPTEDELKDITLPAPEGWNIGRVDCVGRVLGDLTKEAVFTVVPEIGYTSAVRVISVKGDGTVKSIEMSEVAQVDVDGNFTQQNIAQPVYHTMAEAKAADGVNDFYYSSANGDNNYYAAYIGGKLSNFAPELSFTTVAGTNGFDTFVLDGKRYFVRNYTLSNGNRPMDIVITDENGTALATWTNPEFVLNGGYSSIIAEPLSDNTANIYVYNSGNQTGAAAMLNFNPANIVIPDYPGVSADNPIEIATPDDLVNLRSMLNTGMNYIVLTNDIDMAGVQYTTPMEETDSYRINLDGRYHVIRNLSVESGNGSLLGMLRGNVKNLGMEDVNIGVRWFCVGAIAGYAANATIDNCYATGQLIGAGSGGLVGCNSGELLITNCYSRADVLDATDGHTAGLVGRSDANLTIRNSYSSGSITGQGFAAGIVTVRNSKSVTLENVVAWNNGISGATADAVCVAGSADVKKTNVYVYVGATVNDAEVPGALYDEALLPIVQEWDAFSPTVVEEFVPVLKWQTGETGGIGEIITDETTVDAPAVYYNLQGVEVNNPGQGIYIVRRGNKVTKEILK